MMTRQPSANTDYLERVIDGRNKPERELEDYWDRLSRISKNTGSRLYRTDHQSIHSTTYNILVFNRENPFVRIKCETLSMMEVDVPSRGVVRG
jgi:hypothetical protein